MSPKKTVVIATLATALLAYLFSFVIAAPELIAQLVMVFGVFLACCLVLAVLFRLRRFKALEPQAQCLVIWMVAPGTGIVIVLLFVMRAK
jgi:hypothetical protein